MRDHSMTECHHAALEACLGQVVALETGARLDRLSDIVTHWTRRINLIAPSSVGIIWARHILDSAQLFNFLPPGTTRWADLGSGGGFPGLVIAIMAADLHPDLRVTLVESDARKAAFLGTAANTLGLDVTVHRARAENLAPLGADVVSARAVAPLPRLLDHVDRHMTDGGRAILPKGASHASELAAAQKSWHFRCETIASRTDPAAVILIIEGLSRERD